jgi:HlyD family secretion protein
MKPTSKRLLVWIPAGIALAAALAWLFRPQPVAVDLAEVRRGPLEVSVTGEGRTRVRDLYVVSAPVAGRMRRIEVEAGDPVSAGSTVIARIEPGDPAFLDLRSAAEARAAVDAAAAAREHAEAQVRRAQAELDFARSEQARVRKLAESHTVSASELEAAESRARACEAALEENRAEVRVRQSEYQAARARLTSPGKSAAEDCECVDVRSPAGGHVLRVVAESEGIVQAGTSLVEIGDPDRLEVVVDLLSSDAVQVQPGQRVVIEGWGGTRPISGAVRLVEPIGHTKVSALGIEEQRVDVVIDILEPRERWARLGHGYRVEPRIVLWAATDVLKVPLSATVRDGDEWAVFVYEDRRAVPRAIRVGHQDGIDAEVITGLRGGERVVLNPTDRVRPGQRVAPRG